MSLPHKRVQTLATMIQHDEEKNSVKFTPDAMAHIVYATELLITHLTTAACAHTERKKRKTVQIQNVMGVVSEEEGFAFIRDLLGPPPSDGYGDPPKGPFMPVDGNVATQWGGDQEEGGCDYTATREEDAQEACASTIIE